MADRRTTDIVARYVFTEALDDPNLVMQVQTQRPINLDYELQVAQHMEAVMRTATSKLREPVRAVVQGSGDQRVEVEVRYLMAGQRQLLDVLQQLPRSEMLSRGSSRGIGGGQ